MTDVALLPLSSTDLEWLTAAWEQETPLARDGLAVVPGGVEPPPVLRWIASSAARVEESLGAPAAFGIVVGGVTPELVGLVSLRGASVDGARGAVELGYGVASSRRGHGYASAAVCALVARRDAGLLSPRLDGARLDLVAETTTDNVASQRVLERAGFARVGTRVDADEGELRQYRLDAR